jgi:Tfp pilus assembly protein PilX
MSNKRYRQQGVALFVGLIMLVLITLLAITSFNLGAGSLLTVGNIQGRNQATVSAQHIIDEVISTPKFVDNPQFPVPLGGGAYGTSKSYDINGDGGVDIAVTVEAPVKCVQGFPIEAARLDLTKAADVACTVGVGETNQTLGVEGASTGFSYCAQTVWEIHATATDAVTNAKADITEGVGVRVSRDTYKSKCTG